MTPSGVADRTSSGVISSTPPSGDMTNPNAEGGAKRYGDEDRKPGPLMARPKHEAARYAYHKLWKPRDREYQRRIAQWEVNEARRAGIAEARLKKEDDRWIAWIPRWAKDDPDRNPTLNKLARLLRRFASQMFADPPASEATPSSGEDEDADAAEVATRVLQDIDGESMLDEVGNYRQAFDLASTYDSGFIRYYIDERGGGKVPLEVEAGYAPAETDELGFEIAPQREAKHFLEAELDPETGMPWPQKRTRYVMPTGELTDEKTEAATRYLPAICAEVLTGRNVRLIPHTARDVSKAKGVQIATYVTWGELLEIDPKLATLPADKKEHIFRFRPEYPESMLTEGSSEDMLRHRDLEKEERDEQLIFTLLTYYKAGGKYPDGVYMLSVADSYTVYRDDWVMSDEDLEEPLEIPVVQVKQFQEGTADPFGKGAARLLGQQNDLRGMFLASALDYLERVDNQKTYLPTTSNLTPADLHGETRVLRTVPGTEPKDQQITPYPQMGFQMFELVGQEMDDDLGLGPMADDLTKGVDSGRQAYAAISAAHAGLSEPRQNIAKAWVRGARIKLQMIRAFFDRQQKVRWLGDDNRYKIDSWSVSDLRSTRDAKVQAGTNTSLTPAQKTQMLEHYYMNLKLIPPEEMREALTEQMGGTITFQDDPVRNRIRSQLADWTKGPPEGWVGTREGEIDPAWDMWLPVPSDTLPWIAPVRAREVARFMQSSRYTKWKRSNPEWCAVIDAELERMQGKPAPVPATGTETPPPGAAAEAAGAPPPEAEFGITGPDVIPEALSSALPPEESGIPGNLGAETLQATGGMAL